MGVLTKNGIIKDSKLFAGIKQTLFQKYAILLPISP
jgi:hypothetical protein